MQIHRNDLLTRRIRRVLQVFANGPRSYNHSGVPNIVWNEEIMPKYLYPDEDLLAAREEREIPAEEERVRQEEQRVFKNLRGTKAAEKRKADAARVKKMQKMAEKKMEEKKRKEEEEKERKRREEEEEGGG